MDASCSIMKNVQASVFQTGGQCAHDCMQQVLPNSAMSTSQSAGHIYRHVAGKRCEHKARRDDSKLAQLHENRLVFMYLVRDRLSHSRIVPSETLNLD